MSSDRFGEPSAFEHIEPVPAAVQDEFRGWVASGQRRREALESIEGLRAAEAARSLKRSRAEKFAAAQRVARDDPSSDGAWYSGLCAGCSAPKQVRFTRFEERAFGLCADCYFSRDVW